MLECKGFQMQSTDGAYLSLSGQSHNCTPSLTLEVIDIQLTYASDSNGKTSVHYNTELLQSLGVVDGVGGTILSLEVTPAILCLLFFFLLHNLNATKPSHWTSIEYWGGMSSN